MPAAGMTTTSTVVGGVSEASSRRSPGAHSHTARAWAASVGWPSPPSPGSTALAVSGSAGKPETKLPPGPCSRANGLGKGAITAHSPWPFKFVIFEQRAKISASEQNPLWRRKAAPVEPLMPLRLAKAADVSGAFAAHPAVGDRAAGAVLGERGPDLEDSLLAQSRGAESLPTEQAQSGDRGEPRGLRREAHGRLRTALAGTHPGSRGGSAVDLEPFQRCCSRGRAEAAMDDIRFGCTGPC